MTSAAAPGTILLVHPALPALDPISTISASLAHLLMALAAICAVISGALLAVGRFGARLQRGRQHLDTAEQSRHLRARTLPWASICCYTGAGLLLLTAVLLVTDTRVLQ